MKTKTPVVKRRLLCAAVFTGGLFVGGGKKVWGPSCQQRYVCSHQLLQSIRRLVETCWNYEFQHIDATYATQIPNSSYVKTEILIKKTSMWQVFLKIGVFVCYVTCHDGKMSDFYEFHHVLNQHFIDRSRTAVLGSRPCVSAQQQEKRGRLQRRQWGVFWVRIGWKDSWISTYIIYQPMKFTLTSHASLFGRGLIQDLHLRMLKNISYTWLVCFLGIILWKVPFS